jgi:hypothetical protein
MSSDGCTQIVSAQQLAQARMQDDGSDENQSATMDLCVEVGVFSPGIEASKAPRRRTKMIG